MKLATILLLTTALPGFLAPLTAGEGAPVSDVAIAFTGGAFWTSASTGICVWQLPVVGTEELGSLFAKTPLGAPIIDKEHAYLLWVSDFSAQPLMSAPPYALMLVPAGTATIYFTDDPASRNFTDLSDRRTWGTPVATFVRKASVLRSADNFASDNFIFSADLTSSVPFTLNGNRYDFKKLVPNGMTCHEYGQAGSSWESGVCVAKGN
jgi:hypothetical protein